MTSEKLLLELFKEGNPVPDSESLKRGSIPATGYLASLERRDGRMTKTQERTTPSTRMRGRPVWIALALVAAVTIGLVALLGDSSEPVDVIDGQEVVTPTVNQAPAIVPAPTSPETEPAVGFLDFSEIEGSWFGEVVQSEENFVAPIWADVEMSSGAEVDGTVATIIYRTSAETERVFCEGTWRAKLADPPTYVVFESIPGGLTQCGNGTVTLSYDAESDTLDYLWDDNSHQVEGTLSRTG